ncbi:MAG: nuclear transport factor 2 family protein [Solirubrobacterales bacterium]
MTSVAPGPELERSAPAEVPERVVARLVAAINDGRLGDATECFSRKGCLVTPDATAVHGRDEIQRLLEQLIARRSRIEVVLSTELRAGDVALSRQRWLLHSDADDGSHYTQQLTASLILHFIEGSWKLVIAAPWS